MTKQLPAAHAVKGLDTLNAIRQRGDLRAMRIFYEQHASQAIAAIRRSVGKPIAFDFEGTGLNVWADGPHRDLPVGISICALDTDGVYRSWYVPTHHGIPRVSALTPHEAEQAEATRSNPRSTKTYKQAVLQAELEALCNEHGILPWADVNVGPWFLDALREVWHLPSAHWAHNVMYDLVLVQREPYALPVDLNYCDTMISAHQLFTDWGSRSIQWGDHGVGSKRLKWLGALFGLEASGASEDDLSSRVETLAHTLRETYNVDVPKQSYMGLLHLLNPADAHYYAAVDTLLVHQLRERLDAENAQWGHAQTDLNAWWQAANRTAYRMYATGFTFDAEEAATQRAVGVTKYNEAMRDVVRLSGWLITSVNSSKQVVSALNVLLAEAGLPTVTSSDKATLTRLANYHADTPVGRLATAIVTARGLTKLINDKLDKWHVAATECSGVVHPILNVTGTATGRFSSGDNDPVGNMQNVARNVDGDVSPKKLLRPRNAGWVTVELDYSQFEMRLTAYVVEHVLPWHGEPILTQLIADGVDLHAYMRDTANIGGMLLHGAERTDANMRRVLNNHAMHTDGWDEEKVEKAFDKLARSYGKTTNFACNYGAGGGGVAKQLDIPVSLGQELVDAWKAAYPSVVWGRDELTRMALLERQRPDSDSPATRAYLRYPSEMWGAPYLQLIRKYHKYPVVAWSDSNGRWNPRRSEARKALSTIVQGSCGLIMADVCRRIDERFDDSVLNLHVTVHDSVCVSIHPDRLEIVKEILHMMTHPYTFGPVPIAADVEAAPPGMAWGFKRDVVDIDRWIATKGVEVE